MSTTQEAILVSSPAPGASLTSTQPGKDDKDDTNTAVEGPEIEESPYGIPDQAIRNDTRSPGAKLAHDAAASDGTSSTPTMSTRLCGVCNREPGKYKCPQCSMPYCSVGCNRVHRDTHANEPKPPGPAPVEPASRSSAGKKEDPSDPYSVLLDHSTEFKALFRKYPDLETRLSNIHQETLPPKDGDKIPGLNGGLPWKLLGPERTRKKPEVWSRDVGLRRGAAALRKARTDPSELGDGVREYCNLVLHILSQTGQKDVTSLVRDEVVQQDTRVIEQLLQEEKDWT